MPPNVWGTTGGSDITSLKIIYRFGNSPTTLSQMILFSAFEGEEHLQLSTFGEVNPSIQCLSWKDTPGKMEN
jgi:hypothetical protein